MTYNTRQAGTPEWTAIYRSAKHTTQEIVLNSIQRPARERTFRVPGVGNAPFIAVSITRLEEPKEGFRLAKKKRKRKQKKSEEEVEELEGLDELEDEDDEDEEEPDVEEDEDEDEDEDDEDDEEDEDEEEEKPKKKKKGKAKKGKGKKKSAPTPRELPKGKLSAQDIAEMADTDARAVRLFLRKKANKKKFPKDKELGRYAFTKTDAKKIVKAMKASAKDEDEEDDEE